MIKKFLIFFIILCTIIPCYAWIKKPKPSLMLSDSFQGLQNSDGKVFFKVNSRIYFSVSNPAGFKSDYIKYQVVKQEDNAHVGGYTRVRNVTCRVRNKNNYTDYFVLSEKGKYFIQVFDITNLQQWIVIGGFQVIDE